MGTINLQGVGSVSAISAGELKVGDVCVWNFGYKSEVVDVIVSKTGKTITAMLKSCNDGIVRGRRLGVNSLVGVAK
ncbi:hypothetical protein [Paenibacillus aceti]|uniref:Uncharacterized protein n=1 Tax=Paenibacillus aceti TaxID=1820010 RepID=A0ABQ1VPB1_9BACL|nr:hypothetical protein [Paenibacillus aceti]GGF86567.1 hypothetical protein GCM10010913_05110 [Paenibacillus aceti]